MRWSAAVERRKAKERKAEERKAELRRRNAVRMAASAGKLPPPRADRYEVKQRSIGWFDVQGPAGVVNDRAMRKTDAENLARGLNDASR